MYVVTWWEGETRRTMKYKEEHVAQKKALLLRKSSDACIGHSFVPIRVIPQAIYDRMQELDRTREGTTCRHGLLRLCVKCLGSSISDGAHKVS